MKLPHKSQTSKAISKLHPKHYIKSTLCEIINKSKRHY